MQLSGYDDDGYGKQLISSERPSEGRVLGATNAGLSGFAFRIRLSPFRERRDDDRRAGPAALSSCRSQMRAPISVTCSTTLDHVQPTLTPPPRLSARR